MTNKKMLTTDLQFSRTNLRRLRKQAKRVLKQLVTTEGIYASTNSGWKGAYHAWFGRDSAITADLIFAAAKYKRGKKLAKKAYDGLQFLATWQGRADNPATGEQTGRIPHEINANQGGVHIVQHAASSNHKPWFIDPADNLMKNWDSCDSTPLWIIATARGHTPGHAYSEVTLDHLKLGLEWCLRNLQQFDGLVGFMGADFQPERVYSGIRNQGWKDSYQIYQYPDGTLAKHPIKDVLINAEVWAALHYGADIFQHHDLGFAHQLRRAANALKKRFNDPDNGFLYLDKATGQHFFAQALDGHNQQLIADAADVGMCLWAYHEQQCVIDEKFIDEVVDRIMRPTMFNPQAGMRNYSLAASFKQGTNYHGSSHTYWPFVSALTVDGLDHFGYRSQARAVATAMLRGVSHFHSNIELFVETSADKFEPWHHPTLGQQSAANQAWTAGGINYATTYLLR